jgi:hypothetical protein
MKNIHCDENEKYFANCSAQHRIIFEATTHYLYQKTAIEVLSKLQPQPQIVFVLRKPSARVYSSFQYSKHNLANVRRELTFSQFVEEVNNKNNVAIRRQARESAYVLTNDIRYSRYIEFLPEWFAQFGRERVHVFLFEEMRKDPRAFMKALSQKIGVDAAFYDDYNFQARNETTSVRAPSLHRGVRKLNGSLPNGGAKNLLKKIYFTAQSRPAGNGISPEDKQTLHELDRYFGPFNQRLASEMGLNLSLWD